MGCNNISMINLVVVAVGCPGIWVVEDATQLCGRILLLYANNLCRRCESSYRLSSSIAFYLFVIVVNPPLEVNDALRPLAETPFASTIILPHTLTLTPTSLIRLQLDWGTNGMIVSHQRR